MSNNTSSFLANDRFASYVGIKLLEVKPGYAVAKLKIQNKHLNAANIVQGGVTFTLADFAFAAASNSHGQLSLGISAYITYYKPPRGKELIAKANEIHRNGKMSTYHVDVFDENMETIARFTGNAFSKNDHIIQ